MAIARIKPGTVAASHNELLHVDAFPESLWGGKITCAFLPASIIDPRIWQISDDFESLANNAPSMRDSVTSNRPRRPVKRFNTSKINE